jgi:hypothetical protein
MNDNARVVVADLTPAEAREVRDHIDANTGIKREAIRID